MRESQPSVSAVVQERTMIDPKHYQDALAAQSACNLSGVVFSFCEAMKAICEEDHKIGGGTDWKNHHAICRLYAEQIMWLTSARDYTDAHAEAVQVLQAAGMQAP
jgi:hypothetical protein